MLFLNVVENRVYFFIQMKSQINLVGTVHREGGECNSKELYKIIERISPETVFEEISPKGFKAIYEGLQRDTLESKTLKRYSKNHSLQHLAVDIEPDELIDVRLKSEIIELFDIFNSNPQYSQLSNQHNNLTEHHGFSYLNSDYCSVLLTDLLMLEEKLLRTMNQERFFKTYKYWLDINAKRENMMLRNIYHYSYHNEYRNALFLVGAAHRKSMIEKIPKFEKNAQKKLNWIF